jgi:serine/threonine-protein kinase
VYRDYKPSNVLLSAYGISKLADFGVAERAEPSTEDDPDATTPAGVGTPAYMAPEQWDGAPARPVTDIYAVTASFFECLTGRVPYKADTVYELQEKHRTAPIPLDDVPAGVKQLVARGLAKDADQRPQDVWTFVAEVEQAATEAYGVDWEERGREEIVVAWPLLALLGAGNLGEGGAGGLDALGLGHGDPGGVQSGPEGLEGGSGGSGPETGEWDDDLGPRRRGPDKVKAGAAAAGVAAVALLIAAVAFAGDPKNSHQAGPPGSTAQVFTPTAGGPTGTPTGDPGNAPSVTASGSSSSNSSSSSSRSSSSSSSSSSPSTKPPSNPSTPTISIPLPSPPGTSTPSSAPSTSTPSTPPTSVSTPPPLTIAARVSLTNQPVQCVATYSVVFSVGNPPGGSVTVDYSWHLTNGSTVAQGPITLKRGPSQIYAYRELENSTSSGDVYVTWSADGSSGQSNSVPVTIICTK